MRQNDRDAFDGIMDMINVRTGLAAGTAFSRRLEALVSARAASLAGGNAADYAELLRSRPGASEWPALIEAATVGETFFWRYPAQWDVIRKHFLPRWIAADRPIRVWSAGCSIGAEPYSLVILIAQAAPSLLASGRIKILATDISEARLAVAREATYGPWHIRGLPTATRAAFFRENGRSFNLLPAYRRHVTFQVANLAEAPDAWDIAEAGQFDLVLCRNVLIYFEHALAREVIRGISHLLHPDGCLMTGHSEPFFILNDALVPIGIPQSAAFGLRGSRVRPAPPSAARTAPRRRPQPAAPRRPAREAAPEKSAVQHFEDALLFMEKGDDAAAAESLRMSLYLDPNLAIAQFHRGLLLLRRGDKDGANRAFRNVVRCLDGEPDEAVVPAGGGTTVSALRHLARLRLGQQVTT